MDKVQRDRRRTVLVLGMQGGWLGLLFKSLVSNWLVMIYVLLRRGPTDGVPPPGTAVNERPRALAAISNASNVQHR